MLLCVLELVELAIETLAAEKLFMATLFYDASFMENNNTINIANG